MKEDDVTLDELRSTRWWALWVAETGGQEPDYEPISVALTPRLQVEIIKDSGDWYLMADSSDGECRYSMACVPTRKEAVALCREMGWKITK